MKRAEAIQLRLGTAFGEETELKARRTKKDDVEPMLLVHHRRHSIVEGQFDDASDDEQALVSNDLSAGVESTVQDASQSQSSASSPCAAALTASFSKNKRKQTAPGEDLPILPSLPSHSLSLLSMGTVTPRGNVLPWIAPLPPAVEQLEDSSTDGSLQKPTGSPQRRPLVRRKALPIKKTPPKRDRKKTPPPIPCLSPAINGFSYKHPSDAILPRGYKPAKDPPLPAIAKVPSDVETRKHPITALKEVDIALGRGSFANHNVGNKWFRKLADEYRLWYCTVVKIDKLALAHNLLTYTRLCGARYLTQADDGLWFETGDDIAVKKCSQLLREGAAHLVRIKLTQGDDHSEPVASGDEVDQKPLPSIPPSKKRDVTRHLWENRYKRQKRDG